MAKRLSVLLMALPALIGMACASPALAQAPAVADSSAANSAKASSSQAGKAGTGPAAATASESIPASQGNGTLDHIKKEFEARFPGVEVTGVAATPYGGLYEVQLGTDLVYTDAGVDYVMQGSLLDTKTRTDVTARRQAVLSRVAFDSLPLNVAIKEVKGDGSRVLAAFEDPNCPYCKQLHKALAQLDNYTFYTFLIPILGPDSEVKARNIWCAPDKAEVWSNWMLNGKAPPAGECETPFKQTLALAKKLSVQGTSMIIFADGTRVNGALPVDALKQRLDALEPGRAPGKGTSGS